MSSSPANPRAIASQLVLLFTLAAALVLCCGLGVLYWMVVRHAFEEDNEVLADKLAAVRADLDNAAGPQALHEELKLLRAGQRVTYWVRVLNAAGATVAESAEMAAVLPPQKFPAPSAAGTSMSDVTSYRSDGRWFALVSAHELAGNQRYTVQLAQDRSADADFTREFGELFVGVLVCGIIASGVIATTVTRRGLRPLAEMTQALERIGPTHLNERVAPAGWPRELQPLATAFDAMLVRLEDSFKRLSQFSADLAHELRTPVTNMRGEAEVALTRTRSPEEYREVIESTAAECEQLSGIIDSLLFLARAEAAREPVEVREMDGRAAVEKLIAFYEMIAEERHVTITCDGNAAVVADPLLFTRALSNLIDNALRFTPDGGAITIALEALADGTKVVVQDTGSGISPKDLPRIFDRFYRADVSRSSQGTGLGLSLVKSIMELHGGTAAVESGAEQGTAVTLKFPQAPTTARRVTVPG
ncbi:MAG: heavy metal sensor histidine kinase [Verrucomicrobiota bacterium]|nr:heavy metal sensor histidine kinase [Verrucomicrobiota bacterium]